MKYKVILSVAEPTIVSESNYTHKSTSFFMYADKELTQVIEQNLNDEVNKYNWEPSYQLNKGEVVYCKSILHFEDSDGNIKDIPSRPMLFRGGETEFKASNILIITPELYLDKGVDPLNTKNGSFRVYNKGFNLYSGSEVHTSTTWMVRDTDGNVIWSREKDEDNLESILLPEGILEDGKVYEIVCILHGHDNESNPGKLYISPSLDRRGRCLVSGNLYKVNDSFIRVDIVSPFTNSVVLELVAKDGSTYRYENSVTKTDEMGHERHVFTIPETIVNKSNEFTIKVLDGEEVVTSVKKRVKITDEIVDINSFRHLLVSRGEFTDDTEGLYGDSVNLNEGLVTYDAKQWRDIDNVGNTFAKGEVIIDISNDAKDNTKPVTIGLRESVAATLYSNANGPVVVIDSTIINHRIKTFTFTNENIRVNDSYPLSMVKDEGNLLWFTGIKEVDGVDKQVLVKLNYKLGTKSVYVLDDLNNSIQCAIVNSDDYIFLLQPNGELYQFSKNDGSYSLVKTLFNDTASYRKFLRIADDSCLVVYQSDNVTCKVNSVEMSSFQITNSKELASTTLPSININILGAVNLIHKNDDKVLLTTYI